MSYVGVGRRFVAILVDMVVSLAWTVPLAEHGPSKTDTGVFFGLSFQLNGDRWEIAGARFLVYCLIWFAYFIVMEGTVGATVGKLALGIRVVRPDGSVIGWSESFVRNAFRLVDGFPYVLPYVVGAIVIWSGGPTKRRVGDRVGQTCVVTKGSVGAGWTPPGTGPTPGGIPPMPPPPPVG